MKVYRLSKGKYKNDLSGKGAEIAGGRWNSKGVPVLYTSQSRALCATEIAVHSPLGNVPSDYWIVTIEFPDTIEIPGLDASTLTPTWKSFPHTHTTQAIGDAFIREGKFMVLQVPSAVITGDFNYLLNPNHALFKKAKIVSTELFEFDQRLFIR